MWISHLNQWDTDCDRTWICSLTLILRVNIPFQHFPSYLAYNFPHSLCIMVPEHFENVPIIMINQYWFPAPLGLVYTAHRRSALLSLIIKTGMDPAHGTRTF